MRWSLKGSGGLFLVLLLAGPVFGEPKERDIQIPIVPPDQLEKVKKIENPFFLSEGALRNGKRDFRRACVACHGSEGDGNGPIALETKIDPKPRNFTNPRFQQLRSDGELFWVLKNGSHETEMMRMDYFFTDEELWSLVGYIRTLAEQRD